MHVMILYTKVPLPHVTASSHSSSQKASTHGTTPAPQNRNPAKYQREKQNTTSRTPCPFLSAILPLLMGTHAMYVLILSGHGTRGTERRRQGPKKPKHPAARENAHRARRLRTYFDPIC